VSAKWILFHKVRHNRTRAIFRSCSERQRCIRWWNKCRGLLTPPPPHTHTHTRLPEAVRHCLRSRRMKTRILKKNFLKRETLNVPEKLLRPHHRGPPPPPSPSPHQTREGERGLIFRSGRSAADSGRLRIVVAVVVVVVTDQHLR